MKILFLVQQSFLTKGTCNASLTCCTCALYACVWQHWLALLDAPWWPRIPRSVCATAPAVRSVNCVAKQADSRKLQLQGCARRHGCISHATPRFFRKRPSEYALEDATGPSQHVFPSQTCESYVLQAPLLLARRSRLHFGRRTARRCCQYTCRPPAEKCLHLALSASMHCWVYWAMHVGMALRAVTPNSDTLTLQVSTQDPDNCLSSHPCKQSLSSTLICQWFCCWLPPACAMTVYV